MSALLFLDTETTGLSLDDHIWEFAAIRRESDEIQTKHHMLVDHDPAKCARLPESFAADHLNRFPAHDSTRWHLGVATRGDLADLVAKLTVDHPHIVGAVPNFDTERLALLLREYGYEPQWHYHLIDVENLAVGYLAARGSTLDLPWDSDVLSLAVGIEPPGEGERHTAMGDARWAMRVYDAITGGAA